MVKIIKEVAPKIKEIKKLEEIKKKLPLEEQVQPIPIQSQSRPIIPVLKQTILPTEERERMPTSKKQETRSEIRYDARNTPYSTNQGETRRAYTPLTPTQSQATPVSTPRPRQLGSSPLMQQQENPQERMVGEQGILDSRRDKTADSYKLTENAGQAQFKKRRDWRW